MKRFCEVKTLNLRETEVCDAQFVLELRLNKKRYVTKIYPQ